MKYIVTVYFKGGSVSVAECKQEGEMLDRVRYASQSEYTSRVEVLMV